MGGFAYDTEGRAVAAAAGEAEPRLLQQARARADIDYRLDGLLRDWHAWRGKYRYTRGHAAVDSTCRDYRAPGHWDWQNGAADARADDLVMRAVEESVSRVPNTPEPWRTAIEFHAANLGAGARVWSSPRLPADPTTAAVLLLEARTRLLREMRAGGVLG